MDFCFRISGMAGDGIRGAGTVAARLFARHGYHVFAHFEYQSLIRGGYNAAVVRVSDSRVGAHSSEEELLVALREDALHGGARLVVYDSSMFTLDSGYGVPMKEFAEAEGAPEIFRNAAALGVVCWVYGLELEVLRQLYRDLYGRKAEVDVRLAEAGYSYASRELPRVREAGSTGERPKPVLTGNQAAALGAVKAGLRYYYAYPMTPSTQVLHFLAGVGEKLGVTVVQPENEIAVAVMAAGTAFAGGRVMVGTSGGGFALMQEAFSMLGMAELPVLFIEAQRAAPSTGVPTYHAQQDLRFVLHAGHGEFPRLVASPADAEDAFYLAGELLNLVWRFQVPGVLLMDRYLCESATTAEPDVAGVAPEEPELWRGEGEYRRYALTPSGVSPLAFPPEAVVKVTGNEHDEAGFTADDAETVREMYAKRMRKEEAMAEELERRGSSLRWWCEGEDVVVTWGSSVPAAAEACEELGLGCVQVRYLAPFPARELEHLRGRRVVCVECNYSGALRSLLREHLCVEAELVGRWDGRPFTPEELTRRLEEVL